MAQDLEKTSFQILYIDDDPVNRTLVNRILTGYEFSVLEASTGIEGLQIAQQQHPDLILMDINMPGLDGYETTTRMRSITGLQNIPIVAITANVTRGARQMAIAAGCDGYIPKPIDIDNFPHQVIAYLEGEKDAITSDERQYFLGKYSQKLVERLEVKIMALEEANIRLQKIDKLKSDFITIAAHELRTPITLVYGYARLLQSEIAETKSESDKTGDIEDLADRIFHSTHRLSEVVNDILNISLIDAEEMRLNCYPLQLHEIINEALAELAPPKNDRELNVSLENLDELPMLNGDARRLRQVFWNILSNAIKFTPDHGSILVKGWVAPPAKPSADPTISAASGQDEQDSVIIMIEDTGIGISLTEQKEIFERFYAVGNTAYHSSSKTAFKGGGIGLGLPIAKGIVEAHGGRIWVESRGRSKKNPGSKFYVLLPVDPIEPF